MSRYGYSITGRIFAADGETFVDYTSTGIMGTVALLEETYGERLTYKADTEVYIAKLYNVYSKDTGELRFIVSMG